MAFNTVSEYFESQTEDGQACGKEFRVFMEREFPELHPKISFSMRVDGWQEDERGLCGLFGGEEPFQHLLFRQDFVAWLVEKLPACKTGKRCVSVKYGDEQVFQAVQEKVMDFLKHIQEERV